MKLAIGILILAALAGCQPKKVSPYTAATGQGIAVSSGGIVAAKWNILEAVKAGVGPAGKAFLTAAVYALDTSLQANLDAALANEAAGKKAEKLEKAYEQSKWVGWRTRHYWRVLIAVWAGIGILSIVAGLTGFMSLSRMITQNMFIMSPFVWVRDWVLKRRNGGANTTTVVVQQAPAPPPTVSVESPEGATPVEVETHGI